MGVLHVEHRIFARLFLRQFQIEVEMAIRLAHEEEKPRRVASDFLEHVFESNEFAGAFAHAHRFAAAGELDHLDQHHLQSVGIVTQALHRRLQARHIAMMIGAPDIDQFGKLTLKFVAMIGDVGGEISQLAVALDHRAIFIVAELRRAKPLGAVLRVEQTAARAGASIDCATSSRSRIAFSLK